MSETGAPQEWLDFREARERELGARFGWLTLRAFHWVPEEPAPLEGLPGRWWVDGDDAVVEASADEGLSTEDGTPVEGQSRQTVAETGRVPWLRRTDDGLATQVELLRRGGRLAIRERAETSPGRETFTGVPTYPYDPAYVVEGRFTPFDDPERRVEVATCRSDLRQRLRALGEVTFELGGQPQRLVATTIKKGLSVEFHDPTNGTETPTWRQLKIADPDAEGRVVLDLNRTICMWFAFTPFATCPMPSEGNRVTVPVRAGERAPEGLVAQGGPGSR